MKRCLFFALLILAVEIHSASVATESQLRERRKALKSLESDLALHRRQLQAMEHEEKGVLNTLSLLDQNLTGTRAYLDELVRTEGALLKSLEITVYEIDSISVDLNSQNQAMQARIRELYIQGRRAEWEQLLSLIQRQENPDRQWMEVQRILETDRKRVDQMDRSVQQLSLKRKELEDKKNELQRLRKRKADEERGLKDQVNRQHNTLESLRKDKAMQKKALDEFEKNQKTMMALIKALEAKKKKEEAEAKKAKKSKIVKKKTVKGPIKTSNVAVAGPKCLPMNGRLISEFGMHEHEMLHTVTRNLGVEIQAVRGASVKAAAAGTVVLVSRIEGRGPSVIVDHGNSYYSVYGHLRKIDVKEGQELRHCQVLGEAGDAESMNGPKLYFQVSEGTRTIDPMEWLKQ